MTDWMPLLLGLIAVGGTLGGVLIPTRFQRLHDAERYERERAEADRAERGAAYLALFTEGERLESWFMSSVYLEQRSTPPADTSQAFITASVAAEFVAPPEAWAAMRPWVEATNLRSNMLHSMKAAAAQSVVDIDTRMREIGAIGEGMDQLRRNFLAAARADLAR